MRRRNSEQCLKGAQWSNMLRCCCESKEVLTCPGVLAVLEEEEVLWGASSLSLDGTSFSAIMLLSKSKWNPHKHCLIIRKNQTNSNSLFYVCCIKCWYWKFIFILMFSYDVGVPLQRSVYDSYIQNDKNQILLLICSFSEKVKKKWNRFEFCAKLRTTWNNSAGMWHTQEFIFYHLHLTAFYES